MSATKSLTQEQNRRVAELLRTLRDQYGNQEKLADALGVRQGTLSGVLNPKSGKGAGGKILAGLAKIAGPEIAAIMGGKGAHQGATAPSGLDTLSMARQAAENLVVAKLTDRDQAWLIMRDVYVSDASVDAFVQAAARRLFSTTGTSPVDPIGTRYKRRRAAGGK